jgi:hypothetical protein
VLYFITNVDLCCPNTSLLNAYVKWSDLTKIPIKGKSALWSAWENNTKLVKLEKKTTKSHFGISNAAVKAVVKRRFLYLVVGICMENCWKKLQQSH